MGALGKLFAGLFGFVFAGIARYVTVKVAIVAAAVSVFLLMLGALTVGFNAAMNAIQMSMPPDFQWGLGLMPTNIPVCMSAVFTSRLAIWMFEVKWAIVKIKLN